MNRLMGLATAGAVLTLAVAAHGAVITGTYSVSNKHSNNGSLSYLSADGVLVDGPITTGAGEPYFWTFTTVSTVASIDVIQNVGSGDYLSAAGIADRRNVFTAAPGASSYQDWEWGTGGTHNPLYVVDRGVTTDQTAEVYRPTDGKSVTTFHYGGNPWTTWTKTPTGDPDGSFYIDRAPIAVNEGGGSDDYLRMLDNGSGDVVASSSTGTSDFAKWIETALLAEIPDYTTIQDAHGWYLADLTADSDDPVLLDGSGGLTDHMKWMIGSLGNGFYLIVNQATGDGVEMWQTNVGTWNPNTTDQLQWELTAVPEPGSLVLLALGLLGVALAARRR